MPFHIATAGIYRPGRISDLASDEGFVPGLAEADRDVGLAFGQIKMPVADHKLDPQARIACMKGVDEWCPSEASRHARSAGHANSAGETLVARGEMTLEGRHRCLDAFGSGSQFLPKCRQSIAAEVAFDQAVAHALLKLGNATLHRGLIDAESLGSCLHAARARERQEMPEIVPCEACSWPQYAILRTAPAIFRLPNVPAIGIASRWTEQGHRQEEAMNPAADQVMDLIFGRWRSQILSAGTELGVFDHLDKRTAKTAETLAAELDADPTLLYRLLRAQAAIGLLEEDGSRGFVLTDKGELLRSDHPQSLKPMARLEEGPQHYALWKHLPAMVRDGKQNAFVREFGRMAFEYALENQDYAERFKQAMTSYSAVQSTLVLEALRGYDFSGIRTFCDVAGGYGHLMCALLLANPGLRGIVLDLPEVVQDVGELWATKLGLQQRCQYVAGDMFEAVPKADAYSLKMILHDWNDAECIRDPVEHPQGGNRAGTGLHCRAHRARARRAAFLQAVRHSHDVLGHRPRENRSPILSSVGASRLEAIRLLLPCQSPDGGHHGRSCIELRRTSAMKIDGRCHCGYVTFEAEIDPDKTSICNCTDCQTLSGSAFRVVAYTRENAFKLLSGELKIYIKTSESGNKRPQSFCPECGTPIYATAAGTGPKAYSIRVGTVRQRDQIAPNVQVWFRSAQPWVTHMESMRKIEKQPQIDQAGNVRFT